MKTIKVTIKGISPLLSHRFSMDGAGEPGKKRTGVPDWKAEANKSLYQQPDGTLYEPADHMEGALKAAAKSFKVAGKRGATYSRLVGSTVSVQPDVLVHKLTDWEVDARPVVVQKARVIRYRPKFINWELDFNLLAADDQLPVSVIKEILDHAGLYCGIGDYRPERGGKFGKFMVTKFEEISG